MTKPTVTLNNLDQLVNKIVNSPEYVNAMKWRLSVETTEDLIDPANGDIYSTTDWGYERCNRVYRCGEKTRAYADLYQADYTHYQLVERTSHYHSDLIQLGRELGELIYAMWPKETKYYTSLKATQFTLLGIAKRLGKNGLEAEMKARFTAQHAEADKRSRNNQRDNAIRNLSGEVTQLDNYAAVIPAHELEALKQHMLGVIAIIRDGIEE